MIPTRRTRRKICEEYGFSAPFMDKIAKGLRSYPDRYPKAVIKSGHVAIFDIEMMLDWLEYRDSLEVGAPVPPFRREDYQ